jgi:hypothetical protein
VSGIENQIRMAIKAQVLMFTRAWEVPDAHRYKSQKKKTIVVPCKRRQKLSDKMSLSLFVVYTLREGRNNKNT